MMRVSWQPSDRKHSQLFFSFLMKNSQFLHCGRANRTVTYDSRLILFDTFLMSLLARSFTVLSFTERRRRGMENHSAHSVLEVVFTADVSFFI